MTLNNAQLSYVYSKQLIESLLRAGLSGLCVSPGFRNSPLILAAHEAMGEKVFTHIDERGAAFFALGLARATGRAAAVICTSGTAAANYFPAVLEAYYANVPLVIITADRPYELIGIGANQAMRQDNLYGNHVHLQVSVPAPSPEMDGIQYLQLSAKRLFSVAMGPRPGPVHINISFREPFLASQEEIAEIPASFLTLSDSVFLSPAVASVAVPEEVLRQAKVAKRPCLLVGPGELTVEQKKIISAFAATSGAPVLAEASSGLGCGQCVSGLFLRFDHYFRSKKVQKNLSPDLVIRWGAAPTSKTFLSILEKTPQIILDYPGEAKNPSLGSAVFLSASRHEAGIVLGEIAQKLSVDKRWSTALEELEAATEGALDQHLAKGVFTEWQWLRQANRYLPPGANIFIGNSMQIRDFDAVFPKQVEEHCVYSNRGLSGIDGILSTAMGVAAAKQNPTHLFVGDITALHDINALSLAKRLSENISLTIWLQNNGGGEIFRMVKTAESSAPEEWFTTPQIVDFAALAKGFGLSFLRVTKLSDLEDLGPEAFSAPGVRIVELLFSGAENMQCRKKFWESFRE